MNTVYIPLHVIEYADKNKLHKPLALFVYMKLMAGSQAEISFASARDEKAREAIGVKSHKTIRKHVGILIKNKWITVNTKKKTYHLNSFKIIHKRIAGKNSKDQGPNAVMWEDGLQLESFKAFMYGALIVRYAIIKRAYDNYSKKQVGVKKERTKQKSLYESNKPSKVFTLPVTYMAKAYEVSKAQVANMKKKASEANYITVQKKFRDIKNENVAKHPTLARKYLGEDASRIRYVKNKHRVQEADLIYPAIIVKTCKQYKI